MSNLLDAPLQLDPFQRDNAQSAVQKSPPALKAGSENALTSPFHFVHFNSLLQRNPAGVVGDLQQTAFGRRCH